MRIKAKLYPYPVLATFNNDYVGSSFDIMIEEKMTDKEIILSMKPSLEDEGLANLIETGDAEFVMHIESSLTSFRRAVAVPPEGCEVTISANQIEEIINLCPFIIATRDVYDYSNNKFNNDYNGASFDFDKGNIIAIGIEKIIRIEKEDDDLANVPSIFSVTEIKDKKIDEIVMDYSGNKIGIRLPSKVYRKFVTQNSQNPNAQPVLHAMLIIPALIQALEEVKHSGDDYYLYEDRRWFRAIQKASKKDGTELNQESITNIDTYNMAQMLMKNATSNGILNLNKIAYEGGGSDDN